MKVLNLSTYDTLGGAARATNSLHNGLRALGVDSRIFCMEKHGDDFSATAPASPYKRLYGKLAPYLDAIPIVYWYRPRYKPLWSTNWFPNNVLSNIKAMEPDIVNLCWIGGGFVNLSNLKRIAAPVVFTLHDSWAFTGGCHVPFDCTRYEEACGTCPQLESSRKHDLSRCVHDNKRNTYSHINNLTVVGPSNWMASCAKKSSLFRDAKVEVIPNCLDHTVFRPVDKGLSRQLLGLPATKRVILFGAMSATSDMNKGFHLLMPALKELAGKLPDTEVAVFGASQPEVSPDLGFHVTYMGRMQDDVSLSILYSAADVMVVPSLQESFGLTALEAMACGTPVAAFGATGLLDIVEHKKTGYLAAPYDPLDLARGIMWILEGKGIHYELSHNARRRVEENFTQEACAHRYLRLFEEILFAK